MLLEDFLPVLALAILFFGGAKLIKGLMIHINCAKFI